MSNTITFEFNLYHLYDRDYEDCIALITAEYDNRTYESIKSKEGIPANENFSLVRIELDHDTEKYLRDRHTNIKELISDIEKSFSSDPDYLDDQAGEALWIQIHGE